MSSIMRWRRGLVVAIGASCPERGGCDHHILSDGRFHRSELPAAPKEQVRSMRGRIASEFARNRAQRRQILLANCQFDRPPQPRHDLKTRFRIKVARLQAMSEKMNPTHMIGFKESMNWERRRERKRHQSPASLALVRAIPDQSISAPSLAMVSRRRSRKRLKSGMGVTVSYAASPASRMSLRPSGAAKPAGRKLSLTRIWPYVR